jgi:hypothetical protein
MDLNDAVVNVHSDCYAGLAVVQACNDDDTVTILSQLTGETYRVTKNELDLAPVTEQAVEWIAYQLMEAWQPFIYRLAHHLAERLHSFARFGEAEDVDRLFHAYLKEPGRVFRKWGVGQR